MPITTPQLALNRLQYWDALSGAQLEDVMAPLEDTPATLEDPDAEAGPWEDEVPANARDEDATAEDETGTWDALVDRLALLELREDAWLEDALDGPPAALLPPWDSAWDDAVPAEDAAREVETPVLDGTACEDANVPLLVVLVADDVPPALEDAEAPSTSGTHMPLSHVDRRGQSSSTLHGVRQVPSTHTSAPSQSCAQLPRVQPLLHASSAAATHKAQAQSPATGWEVERGTMTPTTLADPRVGHPRPATASSTTHMWVGPRVAAISA
jgi:hypothetical protein